jgi:UDP-N-acetylmuramoyl-tripeptide--D-alanyl-D-alanine ligase
MNDPHLPLRTLTEDLEGRWTSTPPQTVRSVSIDSRRVGSDSWFVALPGETTHGHEYLEDAREGGAIGAIVEEPQHSELPEFVVADAARTLQSLSIRYCGSLTSSFRIGITGTAGKTTVKSMLASILETQYRTGSTVGNRNNHLGLPLTLLNEAHGEMLVAEIATNAPGEINTLSRWLKPHVGIVTHVGAGHLEGLGTVEDVAHEKADLLRNVSREGWALMPADIPHRDILEEASAVRPRLVENGMEHPVSIEWSTREETTIMTINDTKLTLPFTGEGLVLDAALAACTGTLLGIEEENIRSVLEEFRPLEGRGRVRTIDGCRVIDGTYNANPESVRTALERLENLPGPRLVVLGDMRELGDQARKAHRQVAQRVSELEDVDVIFVGQYRDVLQRSSTVPPERTQVVPTVDDLESLSFNQYNSALLKASNAVRLAELLPDDGDSS